LDFLGDPFLELSIFNVVLFISFSGVLWDAAYPLHHPIQLLFEVMEPWRGAVAAQLPRPLRRVVPVPVVFFAGR
jgi:hypothetical protein